jgi:hypothetical protein
LPPDKSRHYKTHPQENVCFLVYTVTMSVGRIASIHFSALHATRPYGGKFDLPAVKLGAEPAILTIDQHVQRDEGAFTLGQNGGRVKLRYEVHGLEEIAPDLINQWSRSGLGMSDDCHPGIWIVRDRMPVFETVNGVKQMKLDIMGRQTFRDVTPKEQQAMWDEDLHNAKVADRRYAEWCFREGNAWAAKNNGALIPFIPANFIRAAQHYGLEAMWAIEPGSIHVAPCPYCTTPIAKTAMVCPRCTNIIDLQAYAQYEAKRELAMEDARRMVKEAQLPPPAFGNMQPKQSPTA